MGDDYTSASIIRRATLTNAWVGAAAADLREYPASFQPFASWSWRIKKPRPVQRSLPRQKSMDRELGLSFRTPKGI